MEGSKGSILQGRGGAGNIAPRSPALLPSDLETPRIKSDLYTTGRGGTGNMALNLHSHPELARASQDVEQPPQMLALEPETSVHYGRGGAGNMAAARAGARERNASRRRMSDNNGGSRSSSAVGQFRREARDKEQREKDRDPESAVDSGDGKSGKGALNVIEGIKKIGRAMSGSGRQ
ncbi:hypothetical protein AAFC00_002651 [Neodothiora populina]|uniref:Uncharacterized protein n=1 Tax=Neodothiora populina TaxID=2781224 RepID=A0ABR3P964_9PEZI